MKKNLKKSLQAFATQQQMTILSKAQRLKLKGGTGSGANRVRAS